MAEQESILRIKIDSRNAEKNANSLNKELQSIEKNGDFASKSMDSMSVATRQLAGYMAGIVTVGAAINKMDLYTNLNNRLKLVTTNQTELNTALNDTFAIAQKSYQAWDSVVQVYQRFSDNAKTLGINMQQTAQLTETVSKAVAISGASTQAAEAALTQFGQALASGVLRGEELNSVLEQTPALAKAIAQGMGITVGQLRSVAAEGKITGDVLVKALTKSKQSVDELFSRTDITIGQSITLLSNEVTKFTGEAGKASGAASVLSESIKNLSQNLDSIVNTAIVAGLGLITKAIATKTLAIYSDISALIAQRAATNAQLAEEAKLAQATLAQTATEVANAEAKVASNLSTLSLISSEKTLEAGRIKEQINQTGRIKSATRMAELRKLEATVTRDLALAETQLATARASAAAAQATATAASSKALTIGTSLLGVLGGPVGIGITVASLAAGYLLMRDNTSQATAKLEEQAKVANKTASELKALEGAQLATARQDLAASFKAQNDELARLDRLIGNSIAQISSRNTADAETAKILRDVRAGVMSYDDALKVLNKTHASSPNTIAELRSLINEYETLRPSVQKNADAQATLGTKVKIAGNEAQNAVGKINDNTGAMRDNESAANGAANAQSKFIESLKKTALQTDITNRLISKGWDIDRAKLTANALIENNNKISGSDMLVIDRKLAADKKLKASEDAISDAKKARTKAERDAIAKAKKDAKDAKKLEEDNAETRKQIAYSYSDEIKQIYLNLDRELADIEKSGAGEVYAQKARDRAKYEEEIYLRSLTEQINSFRWSEEEKLNYSIDTQKLIADESGKYNDDIKKIVMDNLEEERAYELANIKLAKEQRIFQAEQAFLSESVQIKRKYELERQEIAKTRDEKERNALMTVSFTNEGNDTAKAQQSAAQGFANAMGIDYSLEEQLQQKRDAIIAYREWFEMTEDEFQTAMLEAQDSYEKAKLQLQLSYGKQITGSFASMFGSMMGEQSRAYKLMFAAEKAFAIASSMIAIQKGIAQASSLAFPYNLVAMASVAAQTASIVSNIKAVADVGFQSGGYTGNGGVSDIAGVVHGKEYVLNAEATKRVGVGTLNAINNGASVGGGITVNIVNNGTPQAYDVQQIDENTVKIIATDIVNKEVTRQLSAPNSPISKGIKQNFNTSNRRG